MSDFSLAELKLLVSQEIGPCVSIYMPIDRTSVRPQQETARLNHFLKQAEGQLIEMEMRRPDAEAILAPARSLISNDDFWLPPREGIALFLSPDFFRYFDDNSIAIEFSEMLTVAEHFQIKPLLPLLTDNGQFYILALKQKHIGLLQGTRDTIRPIHMEDAPRDIHEALGEEVSDTETQGRPMDVGDHHEKFGAYDPSHKEKDRILRYCRVVNGVIHKYLADGQAPLILAGMEYQRSIYREANTYPHLLDQGIEHNVEHLPAEELHRLAWEIAEPMFRRTREHALDRFRQNVQNGLTSDQLAVILEAAHFGRVDTLFVIEGNRRFGKFDPKTMHLQESNEQYPGSADLIDEAAAQTILNGGTVYALPPEAVPELPALPAAMLRY
ncbi:MAG: baeRF3 domain-containing protein [Aggregatilineales bacterium]